MDEVLSTLLVASAAAVLRRTGPCRAAYLRRPRSVSGQPRRAVLVVSLHGMFLQGRGSARVGAMRRFPCHAPSPVQLQRAARAPISRAMTSAPVLPRHLLDIRTILLEPEVEEYARGREILARFPEAERISVASHWRIPESMQSFGVVVSGRELRCRLTPILKVRNPPDYASTPQLCRLPEAYAPRESRGGPAED